MHQLRHTNTFLPTLIPIFLSLFTHLWNPIGFLQPEHDEGIYIQRTLRLLEDLDLRDRMFGYDHPYFGQLLLAGALKIIGYPDSTSPKVGELHSIEILWTIPRLFMGLLAVIDTFLLYKIAQLRYNRNVALLASIIFAVMPITWLLRMVWLDSIQLPFILSAILFATYVEKNRFGINYKNKNLFVLLSGIFLGLAIFTKIPAFTVIPLIGLLIFTNHTSKSRLITFGFWIIPIIMIPLIWPVYAISVGEFDDWIVGINYQTHRTGGSFFGDVERIFKIDPILLTIGVVGIVYAAIKRDLFLLFWSLPYAIFLYFIGFTQYFHFILIFPAFCIAPAVAIVDVSKKIRNAKAQRVVPFVIISAIGFLGLTSTIMLITQNDTTPYFKTEAFLTRHLLYHSNEKMTIIANPFYLWIPKYVFHLDHDYYSFLGLREVKTKNLIFLVDDVFRDLISVDDDYGHRLQKIYSSYDKNVLATFADTKIISSNVLNSSSQTLQINLVDKTHIWRQYNNALLIQENNTLIIKVDTSKSKKVNNAAIMPIHLDAPLKEPIFLTLEYFPKSIKGNAKFLADIRDSTSSKILWSIRLNNTDNTDDQSKIRTFYLPDGISNKPIELRLRIIPQGAGEHFLTIKNMRIT